MDLDTDFGEKMNTHVLVGILFAGSLVLADYTIRLYLSVFPAPLPHPVAAGFTEPITTKLVPAFAVVYFHQNPKYNLNIEYLKSHWLRFGILGGVSLSAFERVMYIIVRDADVTLLFALVPLMHILNAVLIAGFVFATAGRYDEFRVLGSVLVAVIVAMVIHVFWNTLGVRLAYELLY